MSSLIYHAGALGDFITTLPAVDAWRRLHPGQPLVLLGRPGQAVLAEPPFDGIWDAQSAAFSSLFSPSPDASLGDLLRPITSALLFAAPSSPLAAALATIGVPEVTRQDPFPSERIHCVDYHLSLFPGLGFDEARRLPRVACAAVDEDAAGSATVALHPGSGSPRKNWPLDRFVELARRLEGAGERIAWIEGPAEHGLPRPEGGLRWRDLPLAQLAGRLRRCRLFVGNDSGVSHLAAAAGCPTLALFGETNPLVWAPRGRRVRVISSGGREMDTLPVEDVFRACGEMLEKV